MGEAYRAYDAPYLNVSVATVEEPSETVSTEPAAIDAPPKLPAVVGTDDVLKPAPFMLPPGIPDPEVLPKPDWLLWLPGII